METHKRIMAALLVFGCLLWAMTMNSGSKAAALTKDQSPIPTPSSKRFDHYMILAIAGDTLTVTNDFTSCEVLHLS